VQILSKEEKRGV